MEVNITSVCSGTSILSSMPDERAKDAWPCGSFTKERERQDTHSSQAAAAKYCVLLFSQGGENLPERLRHHMGTKNLKKNVMPGFAANELHQEANDDDDCREEALYKMLRCFHFNSPTKYFTVKWYGLTNRERPFLRHINRCLISTYYKTKTKGEYAPLL